MKLISDKPATMPCGGRERASLESAPCPCNSRQTNALRKLRLWVASWERAANYPGVRKTTWDQLVELGYVEQRREGYARFLRLTEKGKRMVDEADQR